MSMPTICVQNNPVPMCQAVTDLIESIALEETALSHILNAEGEHLQCVLGMDEMDFCKLVEANESVANMIAAVSDLEVILKDKLEFISNNLYYPSRTEC